MTVQALIKYTILYVATAKCLLQPQLAIGAENTATKSSLVRRAAILRVQRHDYKAAVALLMRASEQDRLDPAYENEMAASLYSNGQLDQCIQLSDKGLTKKPKNAVLYRCRGLAYKEKGEYKRAIDDFSKLIQLDQMVAANYNDRAALYNIIGQFQLAQKDLKRAVNVQRYNSLALDEKSMEMTALIRAGHYKEAERILPQYLAGQPQKIFYLSDIARGFAQADRSDAAIKCANRYLQLAAEAKSGEPLQGMKAADQTAMRELLVNQYLKQKNTDQAVIVLNTGIALAEPLIKQAPADADGRVNRAKVNLSRLLTARAEVYIAQGKRDSAKGDLERSLFLFPDSSRASELLKKLKSQAI